MIRALRKQCDTGSTVTTSRGGKLQEDQQPRRSKNSQTGGFECPAVKLCKNRYYNLIKAVKDSEKLRKEGKEKQSKMKAGDWGIYIEVGSRRVGR